MSDASAETDPLALRLIVDRRVVRETTRSDGIVWFQVSDPASSVRIVSRSVVPAAIGRGWDERRLGVALRAIFIRSPTIDMRLDVAGPQFTQGFQDAEPGQRWTDGDAVVPANFLRWINGPFEIGLDVHPSEPMHVPRRRRALAVDATTPTPDRDAGSNVMLWHMQILQELDFDVTFVAQDNFAFIPDYTPALHARGITTIEHPRYRDIEALLADHADAFDLIYVHRWSVAEACLAALARLRPELPVIFNNADLHYLRMKREAAVTGDATIADEADRVRVRELAVVAAADISLICSTFEMKEVAAALPDARTHYLPWVIAPRSDPVPGHAARRDIMFLGGFGHPPNADAVRWFVAEVMPLLVNLLPGLCLHVYGAGPTPDIRALANESVVIHGAIPELAPAFDRHRVLVAPLRYGAGFKGKIAEALANGLPVIASPIAAEGSGLADDVELLVASDPTAFAMAVARLERDARAWARLSAAGLACVRERFSPARGRQHFVEVFSEIGRTDLLEPG